MYKDKYGKPVRAYEVWEGKKLVTVTASEEAAELFVLGEKSKYFDPRKGMVAREYPGHPQYKIKAVG